jgi:hypothetical protein
MRKLFGSSILCSFTRASLKWKGLVDPTWPLTNPSMAVFMPSLFIAIYTIFSPGILSYTDPHWNIRLFFVTDLYFLLVSPFWPWPCLFYTILPTFPRRLWSKITVTDFAKTLSTFDPIDLRRSVLRNCL